MRASVVMFNSRHSGYIYYIPACAGVIPFPEQGHIGQSEIYIKERDHATYNILHNPVLPIMDERNLPQK